MRHLCVACNCSVELCHVLQKSKPLHKKYAQMKVWDYEIQLIHLSICLLAYLTGHVLLSVRSLQECITLPGYLLPLYLYLYVYPSNSNILHKPCPSIMLSSPPHKFLDINPHMEKRTTTVLHNRQRMDLLNSLKSLDFVSIVLLQS